MRILHLADLHFKSDWFQWVGQESGNYDVLVIAGDLLNIFLRAATPLPQQAQFVQGWLKTLSKPSIVCSGNHDIWMRNPFEMKAYDAYAEGDWLQLAKQDGLMVDGQTASIFGEKFAAVKGGDTNWPVDATIVVSHAPPAETRVAINAGGLDFGDFEVSMRVWANRPMFICCGHVHEAADWAVLEGASWCFNPGCDMNAVVPNHIIIDTTKKIACWNSERKGCVTKRLTE